MAFFILPKLFATNDQCWFNIYFQVNEKWTCNTYKNNAALSNLTLPTFPIVSLTAH